MVPKSTRIKRERRDLANLVDGFIQDMLDGVGIEEIGLLRALRRAARHRLVLSSFVRVFGSCLESFAVVDWTHFGWVSIYQNRLDLIGPYILPKW